MSLKGTDHSHSCRRARDPARGRRHLPTSELRELPVNVTDPEMNGRDESADVSSPALAPAGAPPAPTAPAGAPGAPGAPRQPSLLRLLQTQGDHSGQILA